MNDHPKMAFVDIIVTSFDMDHFPGWLSFHIVDTNGLAHGFHDKVPVVGLSQDDLTEALPFAFKLPCVVLEVSEAGVLINTGEPYGVESISGETKFRVPDSAVSWTNAQPLRRQNSAL